MAINSQSLGLGRDVFKEVLVLESQSVESQVSDLLGRILNTDQTYEIMKQLAGLGYMEAKPEGETVRYDDWTTLFQRSFTPVMYSKGISFTLEADYTNQYKKFIDKQPALMRSAIHRQNLVASNVYNLGFTDTTYGMNGEVLFATNHSNGTLTTSTGANRPSIDIAFGPLAIEQAVQEIRKQKSARGTVMPYTGKLKLLVPVDLWKPAERYLNSTQLAGTNNNDPNAYKGKINLFVGDYFTSSTAWFMRAEDNDSHKLFMLNQIPYTIEKFARTDALVDKYAAYMSYVAGWSDWRGTWGTAGA